ncbi:MAG TPA: NADH-quinone oxidoreductase subunit L [Ktedonobacteraceae bacterium]|nr:NADH-quinone oxidoreductase subunit L [Ktedonobacteraceae bacterium]
MTNLTLWVLLMPLLGFIILGLIGRILPHRGVLVVALGASGLAFVFTVISFFSMLGTTPESARLSDQVFYTWISSGTTLGIAPLSINFGLLFDPLSAIMLMVVTGVGFLIHIYSAGYMEEDEGFWRFFCYMNFFIFAMCLLVSSDNFLFLLIGWGLVGLASFLLIGFWYQRRAAVAAAQKALVINIIGDFGLMLAIFLIYKHYGTLNYFTNGTGTVGVFNQVTVGGLPTTTTTIICLLLFLACTAKSAQLPLYMWLPDAMEGPTPVSALIHAATMVTAGVYLVARANPLFQVSPNALLAVAVIGGITAIFAASIALFQLDIKRVLAYSTISQLGYMFMSEGAHNYSGGIFLLVEHAFFKALLFLAAGAVIHSLGGEQDMRAMGGLRYRLKITFWSFLIGALAISGIPPLAGFWSKDDILSSLLVYASSGGGVLFYLLWAIGIITAGMTAFYMFRLFFGIFAGGYRGATITEQESDAVEDSGHGHQPIRDDEVHESPAIMTVPMIILSVLSVVGGFVGSYALFGDEVLHPFTTFLNPVFTNPTWTNVPITIPAASLSTEWISTVISVAFAVAGIFVAWRLYRNGFFYKENLNSLYQFVLHKYYVDEFLIAVVIQPALWIGRTSTRLLERDALDGGSRSLGKLFLGVSTGLRRLQTGYVRNYALAILIGVLLIIVYYAVRG